MYISLPPYYIISNKHIYVIVFNVIEPIYNNSTVPSTITEILNQKIATREFVIAIIYYDSKGPLLKVYWYSKVT